MQRTPSVTLGTCANTGLAEATFFPPPVLRNMCKNPGTCTAAPPTDRRRTAPRSSPVGRALAR